MHNETYYRTIKKATFVSIATNLLLAVLKIVFGVVYFSHALFADGIHSLSDVVSDVMVLIAAKFGSQQADADHPYGHGRIETAATMGLSLVVILAGFGIILDMIRRLHGDAPSEMPSINALWIAGISIAANEALYHYTKWVANRIDSDLLRANAWHNRSDAASSIIVFIGIGASLLGYQHVDAIAATIVGLLIIKMGWGLGWSSILELVDTGVDEATVAGFHQTIEQVPGVFSVHQLRTRSMGGRVLLDVHVLVDPYLSVSEGHYIGEQVENCLHANHDSISDVTVHVDPEDDEVVKPSSHLPSRVDMEQQINQAIKDLPGAAQAEFMLHYLDGALEVDIFVPAQTETLRQLAGRYQAQVKTVPDITKVTLAYRNDS